MRHHREGKICIFDKKEEKLVFIFFRPISAFQHYRFVISLCKTMTRFSLVNRVNNRVAVGQRADLHAPVDAARKHAADLIDLDLRHALAHVLEEAAVLVFTGVEEQRRAHRRS